MHPLQVEAVTYIVQRAESLAALFYHLTLYGLLRGAESTRSALWYCGAALACLLGMAMKEIMATAPLMALLYDRTFLAGSFGGALRRRWGLYLSLAATWILLIYLVLSAGLIYRSAELVVPSRWSYALTEPKAVLHYLRAAIWPYPLCAFYA